MNERLRAEIDVMFKDVPKTRKALELKEEIIANAQEKMADLLAKGYREEDAYGVVINSIGDVQELFQELEPQRNGNGRNEMELFSQKRAKTVAIAVGLYILAGAVFFAFVMMEESGIRIGNLDNALLGMVVGILICIIPTMMLVYLRQLTPRYHKKGDTLVEEYREWRQLNREEREIRKAINSVIFSLAVVVYLILSITTRAWYITWIVFVIAACLQSMVHLLFSIRDNKQK